MTQFGYLSHSNSPARQRIEAAGQSFVRSRSEHFIAQAELDALKRAVESERGTLAKLKVESSALCRAIDQARLDLQAALLAKKALRTRPDKTNSAEMTDLVVCIMNDASAKFDVPVDQISGITRVRAHVECRRYVVERLHDELLLSYPKIGRILNRDHTSVLHLYQTRDSWRDFLGEAS